MDASTIKTWFLVHKWTSVVSMAFLLMLCITGLPLIFHHEIDHALGYSAEAPELTDEAARQVAAEGPADPDEMVAAALDRRPGEVVQFVVREPAEPELFFVRLGETPESATMSAFFTYDARTGELLGDYPLGRGIMNTLLRLHVDMFAGLPGTLFLGFMGLLLVASLVSGVALYAPFMSRLRFGTVRRGSSRLRWLDLHNLLGIATFVWLLVVGATGVVNTLAVPIFGQWQATELAEMTAGHRGDDASLGDAGPAAYGSVARAIESAAAAAPDTELSFMAFPGNEFASPRHFVAFMQGKTPWTSKLLRPVLIDAWTAEVVETRELPWYVTLLLLSQPLHFGDYGGMPLKILWALLDLLAIVVLASGVYLWMEKRDVPFEDWLRRMQGAERRAGREPTEAAS